MAPTDKARRVAVELLGWDEIGWDAVMDLPIPLGRHDWIISGLALEKLAEEGWFIDVQATPSFTEWVVSHPYADPEERGEEPTPTDAILTAACAVLDARGGD